MSEEKQNLEVAEEPTSLSALKESVKFVSEGRPLSAQFLTGLSRRLSNLTERQDLVQLAIDNHQMNRLSDVFGHIERLETSIFKDNADEFERELERMDSKQKISLLTSLYKEAQVLARYQRGLTDQGQMINSPPDAIQNSTEEQANHEEVNSFGAKVGPEGRERVRSFIEELQRDVIDLKPVEDDSD